MTLGGRFACQQARQIVRGEMSKAAWLGCVTLLGLGAVAGGQQVQPVGAVQGRVVDLATGEPLSDVRIATADGTRTAATNARGEFRLTGLPVGLLELRVSLVGYGLLKRRVEVAEDGGASLELRLGQDTLRASEQVTVQAAPFDPPVPDAVSQYNLSQAELHDLSTILAMDPFRAVAALPGVSASDDFYAEFSVRGGSPAQVGTYIDGVLVDHPTYRLEDDGNIASLSMVNGDTVESVSLLSGAFPPSYGDRTGSALDVETRSGARDRVAMHAMAGFLGTGLTAEGPLGRRRSASWLLAGRQSYLAYLIQRLGYDSNLTLGYRDIDGRFAWDATPHHRFDAGVIFGATAATRNAALIDGESADFFTHGSGEHGIGHVRWDWNPSQALLLRTEAYGTGDHEHDSNPAGDVNLDTTSKVFGAREDVSLSLPHQRLQMGADLRRQMQYRYSTTLWDFSRQRLSTTLLPLDAYTGIDTQPAAYLEDIVSVLHDRLQVSLGGRAVEYRPTRQRAWLPYAGVAVHLTRGTTFSGAYGQYAQWPTLGQRLGAFGNGALRAQRATHQMVSVEHLFNQKLRVRVELYNRREQEDVNASASEFRLLPNGQVAFPVLGPVLGNGMQGHARGVEISVQRRSTSRLSGWLAYARSETWFWLPATGESFVSDFDTRNSFTAYGAYRLTPTISVSANGRVASGAPVAGYFDRFVPSPLSSSDSVAALVLGSHRNTVRQTRYVRGDVRVSKILIRKHFDLTIHGEIENLTAHRNESIDRFVFPGNVGTSRRVDAQREQTLPFLPAAGLTLDF